LVKNNESTFFKENKLNKILKEKLILIFIDKEGQNPTTNIDR